MDKPLIPAKPLTRAEKMKQLQIALPKIPAKRSFDRKNTVMVYTKKKKFKQIIEEASKKTLYEFLVAEPVTSKE